MAFDKNMRTEEDHSLATLLPGEWLDDNVILHYLRMFLDYGDAPHDVVVLDPQWTKTSPRKSILEKSLSQGLDGHQFYYLPFNYSTCHWMGVLYCVRTKKYVVMDTLRYASDNAYDKVIQIFACILKEMVGIKRPACYVPRAVGKGGGDLQVVKKIQRAKMAPHTWYWKEWWQQPNYYDCGIYTIFALVYLVQNNLLEDLADGGVLKPAAVEKNLGTMGRLHLWTVLRPFRFPTFVSRANVEGERGDDDELEGDQIRRFTNGADRNLYDIIIE